MDTETLFKLVAPNPDLLPSYLEAVEEGFKNMQLGFGNDSVEIIKEDPVAYISKLNTAPEFSFKLNNGKELKITNHEICWITNGHEFIGSLVLRYKGDKELLERYAGYRGLAIRPSLRGKGYGKKVWQDTLEVVVEKFKSRGFDNILITCDIDNPASSHLIEINGGKLIERCDDVLGQGPNLIYSLKF